MFAVVYGEPVTERDQLVASWTIHLRKATLKKEFLWDLEVQEMVWNGVSGSSTNRFSRRANEND